MSEKESRKAVNVFLTNATTNSLNRWEMVKWVNDLLQTKYTKIEDFSNGAAYCNLLNRLFPAAIPKNRIKNNANQEYEYVCNFKLLQSAFKKLGVTQVIPVERLIKAKFQDNYEFAQYFKKFYDANYEYQLANPPQPMRMPENNKIKVGPQGQADAETIVSTARTFRKRAMAAAQLKEGQERERQRGGMVAASDSLDAVDSLCSATRSDTYELIGRTCSEAARRVAAASRYLKLKTERLQGSRLMADNRGGENAFDSSRAEMDDVAASASSLASGQHSEPVRRMERDDLRH